MWGGYVLVIFNFSERFSSWLYRWWIQISTSGNTEVQAFPLHVHSHRQSAGASQSLSCILHKLGNVLHSVLCQLLNLFSSSETSESSPVMLFWKGILVLFLSPTLFIFSSIFLALYFFSFFAIGKYKGLLFPFSNLIFILWSLPTTVVISTRSNASWVEKKRWVF